MHDEDEAKRWKPVLGRHWAITFKNKVIIKIYLFERMSFQEVNVGTIGTLHWRRCY